MDEKTLPPEELPKSPGAEVIIVCPSCEWQWVPEDERCPNCGRGIDEHVN
jgi:rubredoxin